MSVTGLHQTNDKKGVRVSDYATDFIYQGKCFSISQRFTVTTATNLQLLFDLSVSNKEISVYPPTFSTTTGPVLIDVYADADATGGTACIVNNRAFYGTGQTATLTYSPTVISNGDLFYQQLITASHKQGDSTSDELEFVPPQSTKFLIDINNTNGTDAIVLVQFVWFEL